MADGEGQLLSSIPSCSAPTMVAVILVLYVIFRCLIRRKAEPSTATKVVRARRASADGDDGSARFCWSRGYGRFKYTGLRADPLDANVQPPMYSRTAPRIPLPLLKPGEEEKLDSFANQVVDLTTNGLRTDAPTLLRYLRARKGDLQQAEKLFRAGAEYRSKYDIDAALQTWNLEAYERCLAPWWLSGGFAGRGLKGEPVAIERLGRCNFPFLVENVDWETLVKIDIVHCQRAIAALEEDAVRRQSPLGDFLLIVDLDGFGWDQVQLSAARKLAQIVESRNNLMTETIGVILVVNAPPAAVKAWGMLKSMLDKPTADKVQMATRDDSSALLHRFVEGSSIPGYLGGSKVINGDPECRVMLAPGGKPPPEAFERLRQLVAGECESVMTPMAKSSTANGFHMDDDKSSNACFRCRSCM